MGKATLNALCRRYVLNMCCLSVKVFVLERATADRRTAKSHPGGCKEKHEARNQSLLTGGRIYFLHRRPRGVIPHPGCVERIPLDLKERDGPNILFTPGTRPDPQWQEGARGLAIFDEAQCDQRTSVSAASSPPTGAPSYTHTPPSPFPRYLQSLPAPPPCRDFFIPLLFLPVRATARWLLSRRGG